MTTSTHVHMRFTKSDWQMNYPVRDMTMKGFKEYVRKMLVANGFDMSRPIFRSGGVDGFDFILSQNLEDAA